MKPIRVRMIPGIDLKGVSGINTVINSYAEIAPDYNIIFVDDNSYDVSIIHGGMGGRKHESKQSDIAMLHGIYFTAEYNAKRWEKWANRLVIDNILSARFVTVPSDWVAITLRKEFKIDPYILEHGVFWDYWQHNREVKMNQVFWGKNRIFEDVCDPVDLMAVAQAMPEFNFVTTLAPKIHPKNVHPMGLLKPHEIKPIIQESAVVLSTIKETWGLLYIEALAAGTPVVTANVGHVPNLVQHGVGGYSYRHGDVADMVRGIRWTVENRDVLSRNARVIAKNYSWDKTMTKLRAILEYAIETR